MTFEERFDNPESLHGNDYFEDALRRAWKAAAKAEREKCAKVCESTAPSVRAYSPAFWDGCEACAQAIRAMED